jgi:hypothetical protein
VSVLPLFMAITLGQTASQAPARDTALLEDAAVTIQDYAPCGLVSLYLVCRLRDLPVTYQQIKDAAGPPRPDAIYSFDELSRLATRFGLRPVGLRVGYAELRQLPMPAIAQMVNHERPDLPPHFLVLLRIEPDGVYLVDAPHQPNFLPKDRFTEYWTGMAMVFAANEDEAKQITSLAATRRGLTWALWTWGLGGISALVLTPYLVRLRKRLVTQPEQQSVTVAKRPIARRFRWLIAGLAVLGIGVAAIYAIYLRMPADEARCVVEQPDMKLGELVSGEHTVHVQLANPGNLPLHISDVVSSCSCAIVTAPSEIGPESRAAIDVRIHVTPGPGDAMLRIESNDPAGAKRVLLTWNGGTRLSLVPAVIKSPPLPNDALYERTLEVFYPGGPSAMVPELEKIEVESPLVKVEPIDNDPGAVRFGTKGTDMAVAGRMNLRVQVQPPPTPGRFQTKCYLDFRCGKLTRRLTFPIDVEFRSGSLTADVRSVVFTGTRPEELKNQERWVEITGRALDNDIVVEGTPEWLECKSESVAAEKVVLKLRVSGLPAESSSQTITIRRGGAAETKLALPVHVCMVGS